MLNNQQDTEDAVQTVFLNLYRNMKKFKFKSRFTTYLISITRNVCYDILNQKKTIKEDLSAAAHILISDIPSEHDLSAAISKLPEKTRECFVLFAMEGYPQEEVAEILNIKIGTVKAMIFQARQKLISWLAEEEE
jgi:RNA polymerase sigma-70 factor (ECF subfamily)